MYSLEAVLPQAHSTAAVRPPGPAYWHKPQLSMPVYARKQAKDVLPHASKGEPHQQDKESKMQEPHATIEEVM